MNNLWQELKRRNVIKSALAYLVVAWILLQVFHLLLPIVNAPDWVLKGITLIIAIGLPIWIVISWIYDLTPKGIEKTAKDSENELVTQATNKRLNAFIIASLSIAVIVMGLKLSNVFSSNPNQEYSIAVIPFDNIKVDQDKDWLSQNFTQNVNSYLSKVKKLRVIDSYSARKYKDTDQTNIEIGEELDVSYVLRGSVTQLNNKLSITVELIDVISNSVYWSDSYDEKFEEDPLRLQQEVSQKIVAELKVALTLNDENALGNLLTKNQDANIYFNEGVRIAHSRTVKDEDSILSVSANLFQKAIDLDPNYADAYAELAFIMRLMKEDNAVFNNNDKRKTIDSLVKKALEIDPNSSRAYTTLGSYSMNRDWNKAKEYFDKALAIKPNDATNLHYYALYYIWKPEKDPQNALKYITLAHKSNPFSISINSTLIFRLLGVDKIVEAEEFFKKNSHVFTENDKKGLNAYIIRAKIKKACIEKKDWSEAITLYHKEIELDSTNSTLYRRLANSYNDILLDNKNYINYAKKAYEIGELYAQNDDRRNTSSNAYSYYISLLKTEKFKEVINLLQNNYFTSLFDSQYQNMLSYKYHYYMGNYDQAALTIDSLVQRWYFDYSLIYAQQNDIKKVTSILNKDILRPYQKAIVFAVLKERDSMYHYMNKESDIFRIIEINGSIEVDAYRKEDRYKAFLKKNYLPLTHWNE